MLCGGATEHQRDQGWQGQLALAREGVGMIGMGCVQEKFSRTQARGWYFRFKNGRSVSAFRSCPKQ